MIEYDRLIDAYFDNDLSSAEALRLEGWLAENESHRQRLVERSLENLLLRDALIAEVDRTNESHDSGPMAVIVQKALRPTPFSMTVAAIVVGIMVTSMALVAPPFYRAMRDRANRSTPQDAVFVAQITGLHEAVWDKSQTGVALNSHLLGGKSFSLKRGLAEITFRSGTVMVLEGPAVITLENDAKIGGVRLGTGRLAAHVPKSAIGFTVRTANYRIVDLGTEFAVKTEKKDETSVEVFQGSVRVEPEGNAAKGQQQSTTLTGGQRMAFGASGTVQRLPENDNQFTRKLPLRKPAWLIGYDGFDYVDGSSIADAADGTGWQRSGRVASNWRLQNGAAAVVHNGALTTRVTTIIRRYGGREIGKGTDEAPTDERQNAVRAMGRLYYSTTVHLTNGPGWAGISSFDFDEERVFFGKPGGEANFGIVAYPEKSPFVSSIVAANDQTYRIVAVIDFEQAEARLWINPDENDFDRGAGEHTADVATPIERGRWSTALRLGSGGPGEATWDDVMVTNSFTRACQGRAAFDDAKGATDKKN